MPRVSRDLPFLLLVGIFLVSGTPAAAVWTEGEALIVTLDEAAPALAASLGASVDSGLAGDTPILLTGAEDPPTAKDWRNALIRSGLAVQERAGRQIVVGRTDLAERRELLAEAPAQKRAGGVAGGVASGLVAVGGLILPPPYDVTVADADVLVNGVRVFPAPEIERPLPDLDAVARQRDDVILGAAARYRDDRDRAALLERLAVAPGLVGAAWVDETRLRLDWRGEDPSYLELGPGRDADPLTAEAWPDLAAQFAAGLRDLLRRDGVMLAGVGYCLPLPEAEAGAWRERVGVILAAGEPAALAIARLQAHTTHRDAALDLYLAGQGR